MATAHKLLLGPKDHGRPISYDDFQASDTREGYHYELIDGKVYVSPFPEPAHMMLDHWILIKLHRYSTAQPEVINIVYAKTRVFVPGRAAPTYPGPDVAACQDSRLTGHIYALHWEDLSPVLVAEVLSPDTVDKDLVRNVELYLQVPSIREYWVIDGLDDWDQPTLQVHRRRGQKWHIIDVAAGEMYTTKLLPGFELVVDPRK